MKWEDREESSNIEDRRSDGPSRGGGGISMGTMVALLPLVRSLLKTKIGWALIAIGAFLYFSGFNPLQLMNGSYSSPSSANSKEMSDKQAKFAATILRDTEEIWQEIFQQKYHQNYTPAQMVLFRGSTQSGCGGVAQAEVGPFYCPEDAKIYVDLDFLDNLVKEHGGGGDFAEAYVLAHEVGHHVQGLQGTLDKVQRYSATATERQQNAIQVRVELQADCYAGVWANHAQKNYALLEPGDIEEGLNTTAAIGDDVLAKEAQGYVVPDSFTHGTAAQRTEWFKRGFQSGSLDACNTFE